MESTQESGSSFVDLNFQIPYNDKSENVTGIISH